MLKKLLQHQDRDTLKLEARYIQKRVMFAVTPLTPDVRDALTIAVLNFTKIQTVYSKLTLLNSLLCRVLTEKQGSVSSSLWRKHSRM